MAAHGDGHLGITMVNQAIWRIHVVVVINRINAMLSNKRGTNLFHKVGKIFTEEKQRQRRENHNTADAVENGPKNFYVCPSASMDSGR